MLSSPLSFPRSAIGRDQSFAQEDDNHHHRHSNDKEEIEPPSPSYYYSCYTPELPIASSPSRIHPQPPLYTFNDSQHRYWDYVSLEREYKFLVNQYIALRNNSFASPSAANRRSSQPPPTSAAEPLTNHNEKNEPERSNPAQTKPYDECASPSTRECDGRNGAFWRNSSRSVSPKRTRFVSSSNRRNSSHSSSPTRSISSSTRNDGSEKRSSRSFSRTTTFPAITNSSSHSSSKARSNSPSNQPPLSTVENSSSLLHSDGDYKRTRNDSSGKTSSRSLLETPTDSPSNGKNSSRSSSQTRSVSLSNRPPSAIVENSVRSSSHFCSSFANPYLLAFVQLSVTISVRTGLEHLDMVVLAIGTAVIWSWLGNGRA